MITKDLVPFSGTRSFAIMETPRKTQPARQVPGGNE